MGADRERAAEVFRAAIELEGDARRRYVSGACADAPELLREVEALLSHDGAASPSFLAGGRRDVPADAASTAPPTVGPYECLRILGRGGQAVVWQARDRRLGRLVALKIIDRPLPGSEDVVERFKREAALASGLRHPGICTVHDAGITGNVAFIAMQYIEGETLAARIARRATTSAALSAAEILETLRIVEALARALHSAH
jgi:serine/threonine protein kinase